MTDGDKEGSDRPGAGGPLSDTFPEFVKYARNRQKKTRATPAPNPPPSKITASTVLAAAGAVIVVFAIGAVALFSRPGDPTPSGPSPKAIRASAELNLPKPGQPGQVPDTWAGIALGEPLDKLDPRRLRPYSGNDSWADYTFTPDLARPDAFLGLAVHKNRVYKISMRLGEASTVLAGPYIASAQMAYGTPLGYEYLTPGHSHAVTIFQTKERALRLDSVKGEEITLFEVVLIDMEAATERELARARGQK